VDVQPLPHSLGLFYEEATEHLGFRRSSDEYKVMALAAYGRPRFLPELREAVRHEGPHRIACGRVDWGSLVPPPAGRLATEHADLAASVQRRLQEVLLELAEDLYAETGETRLALAGGVALNCVANSWLLESSSFEELWVQPAAGDSGTALGAALHAAAELGDGRTRMHTAALGRSWTDDDVRGVLDTAKVRYEEVDDPSEPVADALARDEIVAWFQGRSEFGPRALGHRSLLAHPGARDNVRRLNDVKGREQFRPVAPMVRAERAADVFEGGPLPSPFMLFTHRVREEWRRRVPAVVHVDGSARAQTVDAESEPLVSRLLERFEERTGVPVLVNTSLNTDGRPMVDDPRDALECFGSAPIDVLAIGRFLVRRAA
ncbi:MAG TPA: carbamoyltransferase C-terminal domain-containing protein, partial [Gaiella sp.]|nr:carbamoyltransferase C-terminal domain-containing protein [Gaiella sp.]